MLSPVTCMSSPLVARGACVQFVRNMLVQHAGLHGRCLCFSRISPLNLAAMAVERYIAVCRPLHHAQICTVQRAYALIALIWGVSVTPFFTDLFILLATQPPSFFSGTIICYPSYVFNTPYHKTHSVVVQVKHCWFMDFLSHISHFCSMLFAVYSVFTCSPQVLRFSFVFLTLIITYLKIFCAARAASGSNQASARNARNTILLHGVQLLICMLSYISPFINIILVAISPRNTTKILFGSFLLTGVLPRLLSPLIYGVRDKKFSSHIRLHFCRKCHSSVEKRVNRTGPRRRSKREFD